MTNNILDITVLPYRSLSKKNFRNLMIIVSIIFFSIGVFFWSLGAWPVFGFLGLDVLLLYLAFKINYKKGEIFESLKLFKSNLVITRVFPSGKSQISRKRLYRKEIIDSLKENYRFPEGCSTVGIHRFPYANH